MDHGPLSRPSAGRQDRHRLLPARMARRGRSLDDRQRRARTDRGAVEMTSPQKPHRIAVIPGDGIGKEVMPEGLRVLDVVAKRFDIAFEFVPIEWSSCDWYAKHGEMMPKDWNQQLS